MSAAVDRLRRMGLGDFADYVQRLERAMLSFTPDGSEFYTRDGDGFLVDVDACSRAIRARYDAGHKAMLEAARLRKQTRLPPQAAAIPSPSKG